MTKAILFDLDGTFADTAPDLAAAQAELDAHAQFISPSPAGERGGSSLADLYDPLTMPPGLVKAHAALDKAMDAAYGYKGGKDDAARVVFYFYNISNSPVCCPQRQTPPNAKPERNPHYERH